MKVLVPIKQVIDYRVNIRVKNDHSGVLADNVKMSMNPFDEIAVEEALRLREQGHVKEVILLTIGNKTARDVLMTGLAMGADSAWHLLSDQTHEPLIIAKLLTKACHELQPDLVIMGKQAIDDDSNQTGQMLAGLLDWPQATFASKIIFSNHELEVTREVDGGLDTIAVSLPAVITTDLRLNEPRYVSLPNIMKAKQKPLLEKPISEFAVDTTPRTKILTVEPPRPRQAAVMLETVKDLVNKLRDDKVL